jgi:FkbM family methyltransferase
MTERDIIESVLSDIESDDVFYDVGAHVGVYSCLIGSVLSEGEVVAFEPHPKNVKKLRENIGRNDIPADIHQAALSNEEGEISMSVAVDSDTTSPTHNLIELNENVKQYGEGSAEQISIETTRGDKLVSNGKIPRPTVIKVDVEGAEFDVLTGLKNSLADESCRVVYCEVHRNHLPKFGASESELHDLLEDCGFTIEKIQDNGTKYHIRAYK